MAAHRRGHNEGSIRQRADGRWEALVTLPHGKRKSYYGRTRAEVQHKLVAGLKARQDGLPLPNEKQTIEQYLSRWYEDVVMTTTRPSTSASYGRYLHLHILPEIGRLPLARLTPQDVQALMNRKLAAGLSPRTVQYMRAILRRALGQALKWRLVPYNVAAMTDSPRVTRPEVQPLSPDQARVFLDAARNHRLYALYAVALAIGLRQGEALGLRWPDVDLDTGRLTVRAALQRVNGKLQLVEPKTARSRRTIALPAVAIEALRAHHVGQLEQRMSSKIWQETGLVFTTTVGTPLDPRNVTRQFQKLLAQAGLPHQRFHDLRHACASLLLAQGVHPRVVMETLGHSQISLTMDTYSHVMPSLQREAADKMDAIFGR